MIRYFKGEKPVKELIYNTVSTKNEICSYFGHSRLFPNHFAMSFGIACFWSVTMCRILKDGIVVIGSKAQMC